jgi:hypothetical protein
MKIRRFAHFEDGRGLMERTPRVVTQGSFVLGGMARKGITAQEVIPPSKTLFEYPQHYSSKPPRFQGKRSGFQQWNFG